MRHVDIAIIGGGLAGLRAANAVDRPQVVLVPRFSEPGVAQVNA